MFPPSTNEYGGNCLRQEGVAHLSRGSSHPSATCLLRGTVSVVIMNTSGAFLLRSASVYSRSYVLVALIVRLTLIFGFACPKSFISLSTHGDWLTHQSQ